VSNELPGLTWRELQDAVIACKSESDAQKLFDAEVAGRNRARWLVRIRGRIRVLRNQREDSDLSLGQE
jgi:hypothetical protein